MSRVKLCLRVGVMSCLLLFVVFQSNAAADCGAQVNRSGNTGYAFCGAGWGSIHVRIECQSGSWPYVAYIDGPQVYSIYGWPKSSATCPGGSWLESVDAVY